MTPDQFSDKAHEATKAAAEKAKSLKPSDAGSLRDAAKANDAAAQAHGKAAEAHMDAATEKKGSDASDHWYKGSSHRDAQNFHGAQAKDMASRADDCPNC